MAKTRKMTSAWDAAKGERLYSGKDVAEALRIGRGHFYQIKLRLMAAGLQAVFVPSGLNGKKPLTKYRGASVDKLIRKAAETGRPLC